MQLSEWVSNYVDVNGDSGFTVFDIISYIESRGGYVASSRNLRRQLNRWVEARQLSRHEAGKYSGWKYKPKTYNGTPVVPRGTFNENLREYIMTVSDRFTRTDILEYCSSNGCPFNDNTFYSAVKRMNDSGYIQTSKNGRNFYYYILTPKGRRVIVDGKEDERVSYDDNLTLDDISDPVAEGVEAVVSQENMERLYAKSNIRERIVMAPSAPVIDTPPPAKVHEEKLDTENLVYILTEVEHELERLEMSGEIATPEGAAKKIVLNTQRNFYLCGIKGTLPPEWRIYLKFREQKDVNMKKILEYLG